MAPPCFRLRPGDFDARQHKGGFIARLADQLWPIWRPIYLQAEKIWHVHGKRGIDPDRTWWRAGLFSITR